MKTKLLLPHKYKAIGCFIAIPAFILMMLVMYGDFTFSFLDYHTSGKNLLFHGATIFNMDSNNFTDEIAGILLIIGLLLIAFSREKFEDERISKIRLESLLWAVLINSVLIMLAIILFYDTFFLQVMVYNICTPLIIFIARFNLVMYAERKKMKTENL